MSFKGNLFGVFQKTIVLKKKFYQSTILASLTYINISDNMEVEEMVLSKNCSNLQMMVRIAKLRQ